MKRVPALGYKGYLSQRKRDISTSRDVIIDVSLPRFEHCERSDTTIGWENNGKTQEPEAQVTSESDYLPLETITPPLAVPTPADDTQETITV